jgi:hypothetical protein
MDSYPNIEFTKFKKPEGIATVPKTPGEKNLDTYYSDEFMNSYFKIKKDK